MTGSYYTAYIGKIKPIVILTIIFKPNVFKAIDKVYTKE